MLVMWVLGGEVREVFSRAIFLFFVFVLKLSVFYNLSQDNDKFTIKHPWSYKKEEKKILVLYPQVALSKNLQSHTHEISVIKKNFFFFFSVFSNVIYFSSCKRFSFFFSISHSPKATSVLTLTSH